MASIPQRAHDRWTRLDPLLRMSIYAFLSMFVWRGGIAVVAFLGVSFNMRDYIWMTQFFGMSNQMYLALVFSGFALIPCLVSTLLFASVAVPTAGFAHRAIGNRLIVQLVLICAAILGVTFSIVVSPSLDSAAVQIFPTLAGGSPVAILLILGVEYAFGIVLMQIMSRKYISEISPRKRKGKAP